MFKVKLRVKLLASFGLVLLLLVAVIGVYQYISSNTLTGFEDLIKEEMEISHRAGAIRTYMLQSRRNEKDFLIRKDKKYLPKLSESTAALKAEAQTIVKLAGHIGEQESVANASAIIGYADEYEAAFKQLVASWEVRGLDHKSGLQGNFRNIVHQLSDDLKGHQIDELRVALLTMRYYEKDFVRTKSDKYKKRFLASIETYKELLEQSSGEEDFKKRQDQALASYGEAFNKYLTANVSSNQQDQYYQTMRTAGHDMADAIADTLVPTSKSLLLDKIGRAHV